LTAIQRLAPAAPAIAVAALTLAFAWACVAFVRQPGLASFADDSVSYLVMGQVLSPWRPASAAVVEAFAREAFYPPLFPAILALAGTAHNFAAAHALTALLLAACLPLAYALGVRWLQAGWAAALATLAIASLPATWIHVKGILSEPLFCALLLAAILVLESGGERARRPWLLALLMVALALTRTVGLIVIAGYAAWVLTRRATPLAERARMLVPALAAIAAYGAWVLIRPAATHDVNAGIVVERVQALLGSQHGFAGLAASLGRQANSVAEAWAGALLLFWVEGQPARVVLAAVVGLLALCGLLWRLAAGRPDAWMLAAYLATFLVWPFYDQMTRFLFPALPVLVLYAFWTAAAGLRLLRRPQALGHGVLAVLILSLTAPALAFIHQRYAAPGPQTAITDWYRTPDLDQALARSRIHLDLAADMQAIGKLTAPQDRVMWVAPSYLALLADRRGVPAPPAELAAAEYRRAVLDSGADYVFLSAYHPRDTLSDAAWRAGSAALLGHAEIVERHPGSVLLRLNK
jgi:hypothetical protein